MNQQTITLTHLPDILLVVLPEGATGEGITDNNSLGWYIPIWNNQAQDWDWDGSVINLPQGNWRIVSTLADLTEEWASDIARHRTHSTIKDGRLVERRMFYNHETNIYGDVNALESFHSAIRASGWYLDDNPIKVHTWASENADDYKKQYDAAQSRVLCRERTLILKKI